ncbi:uncharacterized protein LOC129744908 [Uranotaenia lowii]|uniref:uncharacterized protein LOC129744908 n=1 Tax=Uranotaenia lowii TaxID=190385 RepID=UPI0024784D47|nr:uncharacterized protein LOC129744908 [Uranotaenia lowii]
MSATEKAFDYVETVNIGGQPTDIVYHRFANKSFLLVTQRQKITNVYTVRNQSSQEQANGFEGSAGNNRIYSIKHTFGAASDETEAAIRYLMNFIDLNEEIVITLGLEEINKKSLDTIGTQLKTIV